MKKILTALLTLSLLVHTAIAQDIYIKGALGYGFTHAGQSIDANGFPYTGSALYNSGSTFSSFESKRVSFAQGVPATLGFGYFITKNIGLELNMVIGASNKKHTSERSVPYTTTSGSMLNLKVVSTIYTKNPIFITPSIVIRSNKEGKAYAYMRGGIILPVNTPIREDFTDTYTELLSGARDIYTGTVEVRTKFGVGFNGALGMHMKVAKKFGVFTEAALQSMSLYMKETELVNLQDQTGASVINNVPPSVRVTKYADEANVAGTEVSYALPFSSFGFNVGVILEM